MSAEEFGGGTSHWTPSVVKGVITYGTEELNNAQQLEKGDHR